MEWTDKAIILCSRAYGDSSVILEVLSAEYGLARGLLRGGNSRKMRPILQPGNYIQVTWRARLSSQLGSFVVEVLNYYSVELMQNYIALEGFNIFLEHLRLLQEHQQHPSCYELLLVYLNSISKDYLLLAEIFARFEFAYLYEFGVGLKLDSCAATGQRHALCYVSPKSHQAVCYEAGLPWSHMLLPLPRFLLDKNVRVKQASDIQDSYKLLTYFLNKNIWQDNKKNILQMRDKFFREILAKLVICK